jgi:hypothetical protein
MDRTVIVLTPGEWGNRITLGDATQKAYQHLHYAITKEHALETSIYNLINGIRDGDGAESLTRECYSIIDLSGRVRVEMRESQQYMSNVATVIKHKIKEE